MKEIVISDIFDKIFGLERVGGIKIHDVNHSFISY